VAERFGKYELERKLAVGGMAEIFLATYMGPEGFKKHVAIKRILPHLTEDQDFVTMFLDEARLVARFNHPSIVQIFELGQVQQRYFLAMEYVHGVSMSKVLKACAKKQVPFPLEYGSKILANACEGLEYAHNFTDADGTPLNLIHRDVSPQNIMLSYDGVVKVLDFGIAKAAGNIYQTRTSSLKGKAAYMSPEQITQKSGLDRRSDIFSLGIVLFEFATGKRPFGGDTELELMMSIVQSAPTDPQQLNPNVPGDLAKVMYQALEKDRAKRYQTAREMRAELEHFLLSRQVLVDSYTLGNFVREVVPPGERLVGYSVPTPSRPSLQALNTEKAPGRTPPPARMTPEPVPPPPISQLGDEAATQLTPSEVIRPLLRDSQRPAAVDLPTVEETARKRPAKKHTAVMVLGLVLVVALGAVAAYLALGEGKTGSGEQADAGVAAVIPPPAGDPEPVKEPVDAGTVATKPEKPDAGNPADKNVKPDKGTTVAVAPPAVEEKIKPPEKKRKKKKRRKRRRRKVVKDQPPKPPPKPPPKEEKVAVTVSDKKGSLLVFSKPWTEVYIDGTSYGTTPLDGAIELSPGVHVVQLSNNKNGIKHRQRVNVQSGKRQTIRKIFSKGFLKLYVKPFGDVYINGGHKGMTPLGTIELYEGTHTLRVTCSRTGKEETQKVRIDPGKTRTVKMDLR
jgi:serine/threonine-protein kinase